MATERETVYPAPLLEQAKDVSRKAGYVSASHLQRKLNIGYTRAASIVAKLIGKKFCAREPLGCRYAIEDGKRGVYVWRIRLYWVNLSKWFRYRFGICPDCGKRFFVGRHEGHIPF